MSEALREEEAAAGFSFVYWRSRAERAEAKVARVEARAERMRHLPKLGEPNFYGTTTGELAADEIELALKEPE